MTDSIEEIIRQSMHENKKLLDALGAETPVNIQNNPDKDLLSQLSDLMPKSTEGKLAVVAGAVLLAAFLFSKK